MVCGGEEGESEMSMYAISGIQKNGGCVGVGVELGLGKTDSSVGGWRGDGGNGREDSWVGKRGGERGCGEGRRFLHEKLGWEVKVGEIINIY